MSHKHEAIIEKLFAHPIAANLDWKKLAAALESRGATIEHSHSNHAKVRLNGAEVSIRLPHHGSDIEDRHQIMALRHFLEQQGLAPSGD
ncbi:MAG: hypothetical protein ACOC00_01685 [Halothiobacillaceae bacterium]